MTARCRRHDWEELFSVEALKKQPDAHGLLPEARRCRKCRKVEPLK